MRFRATLIGGVGCLLAVSMVRSARASCLLPSPSLLWSYPAQGATEVPTNVTVWASGVSGLSATLNGEAITAGPLGEYTLPSLEPNTKYGVQWALSGTGEFATLNFTTGAGPSNSELQTVGEVTMTRLPRGTTSCNLVPPQGCFDTGAPPAVSFDAEADAIAWILEVPDCLGNLVPLLWPADCGVPLLLGDKPCARLRYTDGVSVSSVTPMHCSLPALPPGITLPNDGCAAPAASAIVLSSPEGVPVSESTGPIPYSSGSSADSPNGSPSAPPSSAPPSSDRMATNDDSSAGCSLSAPSMRVNPLATVAWTLLGIAFGVRAAGAVRRR